MYLREIGLKMLKYKPCCDRRCLLANCKTRDNGACSCVCRLMDSINTCNSILEGSSFKMGSIYIPPGEYRDIFIASLSEEERCSEMKYAKESLIDLHKLIKKYEVEDA